jgi:hypothetical protein
MEAWARAQFRQIMRAQATVSAASAGRAESESRTRGGANVLERRPINPIIANSERKARSLSSTQRHRPNESAE